MEIMKIIVIALTGLIVASLLKTVNKEITIYVVLATVIIIVFLIINKLAEIFLFIEEIYDGITYGREFFPIILKILAVAYITDFTAQLCKDSGEGSIGTKVELAGKITIFYVAMPILKSILEMIKTLIG